MTQEESRRLSEVEAKLVDIQLTFLRSAVEDHEKRIRPLEDTATRFNFLVKLTFGGGLLSAINLIGIITLFFSK